MLRYSYLIYNSLILKLAENFVVITHSRRNTEQMPKSMNNVIYSIINQHIHPCFIISRLLHLLAISFQHLFTYLFIALFSFRFLVKYWTWKPLVLDVNQWKQWSLHNGQRALCALSLQLLCKERNTTAETKPEWVMNSAIAITALNYCRRMKRKKRDYNK